uniref:Coiled-coil domain containing 169 n=1 Tax=Myripristis murdjan TaxID=586833 RepID=A0A667YWA6_9TELE
MTKVRPDLDFSPLTPDYREMLEESVSDLRSTMCELQERLHSVDGEGNEWKTRYETQIELSGQLERQISIVHERLEDLRGNPMDRLASIRTYDEMPIVSSHFVFIFFIFLAMLFQDNIHTSRATKV